MKCCICKRNIASGVDAQKAIVEYLQPDGTTKIYGYMMSDGPLSAATGQILRAWHHKHYWMSRKREARGDAVTGRVLAGVPTAYTIGGLVLSRDEIQALGLTEDQARDRGTAYLSTRLQHLRDVARSIGKGVGDGTVLEAFWAQEHGGPYPHSHHFALEIYQLRAHLNYAHARNVDGVRSHLTVIHERLHARQDDPGYAPPTETDWRDQLTADVGDLKGPAA